MIGLNESINCSDFALKCVTEDVVKVLFIRVKYLGIKVQSGG